jgi:transcriptional regulator with XRE-family HTH domain
LGSLIKKARHSKKWSQQKLAFGCGWTETDEGSINPRIANYESGHRKPDIHDLVLLGDVLNIAPDQMFHAIRADMEGNNIGIDDFDISIKVIDDEIKNETPGKPLDDLSALTKIDLLFGKLDKAGRKRVFDWIKSKYEPQN